MIGLVIAVASGVMPVPALTPIDIYKRTITAMHSIGAPLYLRFDARVTFTHGSRVVDSAREDFERTEDRETFVRVPDGGAGKTEEVILPIPPDLFVDHAIANMPPLDSQSSKMASPSPDAQLVSGLDDTGDHLKSIATVEAVDINYAIDQSPPVDLPGCASAVHLTLKPTRDPLRYNLRELWINPTTYRICRAVAVWRAPVVTHDQDVSVLLDVDPDGFVQHWRITATARVAFGSYTVQQDVYYSNIQPIDETLWRG